MRFIGGKFDALLDWLAYFAALLLFFDALLIGVGAILRYGFDIIIPFTIDVTQFILLYSTFLAAAWALRHDLHVKITIVSDRLRPRARLILSIIVQSLGASACLILLWQGIEVTLDAIARNVDLIGGITVPKYVALVVIPFASLLLAVCFIRNVGASWLHLRAELRKSQSTERP